MTTPIFLHAATARCAARFIWFIGTCQVVFCGFLFWLVLSGGQFGVFGLVRVPAGGFSDLNGIWQLATDTYAASVMTLAIFGTVLAVTQMLLGFAIHARRRWSATVALVFTLAQCLAVALLLALAAVNAVVSSSPDQLTLSVLILGTPLAVLVVASRHLHLARHVGAQT